MFITIEGIDGSGKTTQSGRLADWLSERTGRETVRTFEPGGCEECAELRRIILEGRNFSPEAELLLFLADRAEHVSKVILPAIREGRNVVCERWNESTIAYQSSGRKLPPDRVKDLITACGFPEPDAKIFLDIHPQTALTRILSRTKHDKFEDEGLTLMRKVSDSYRELARRGELMRIDCEGLNEEEVFTAIITALEGVSELWQSR